MGRTQTMAISVPKKPRTIKYRSNYITWYKVYCSRFRHKNMKVGPSYIQLLSHFTIQPHDAKSAMKPNIASVLYISHCIRFPCSGWLDSKDFRNSIKTESMYICMHDTLLKKVLSLAEGDLGFVCQANRHFCCAPMRLRLLSYISLTNHYQSFI